jgi:hypothetical protein
LVEPDFGIGVEIEIGIEVAVVVSEPEADPWVVAKTHCLNQWKYSDE